MGKAKNLGAISEFEWPASTDGGLTVFTGWHGLGKTTLLNALNTLATGKGKPPVRDRAKSGELEAHGMTLKFGARTTRTGELEIVSMEGKWSLADLIDPKIADPQAADAKRIKALVMLAGVEPDIELFAKCLQDTAPEDLSPETLEAPDLLAMAEKVKRDLEAKARKTEGRAENARGRVQALRQASEADGELPGKEWTGDAAQAELEASLGELGAVRQAGDAVQATLQKAANARMKLDAAKLTYQGPPVEVAAKVAATAKKQVAAREAIWREAEEAAKAAKKSLEDAEHAEQIAAGELKAAEHHFQMVAAWEADFKEGYAVKDVDNRDELATAQERVDNARKLVANVAIRDKMVAQIAEAKEQAKVAAAAEKESLALRDAAKGVDEVLSDAVGALGTKLYVESGRLLIDTPARGPTYYAELSAGERARVAIEITVDQAAKAGDAERLGICVIPQEVFEGLAEDVQEWIVGLCHERRVVGYTARIDVDRELRAEVL
jgi:energy-coupling factor transporter ATP-binding protein EcfA2